MRSRLSDLREAGRELHKLYRRKRRDAKVRSGISKWQNRIVKIHTDMFCAASFSGLTWSLRHFSDNTGWTYKAELVLNWPKTGDAAILRQAHKIVQHLRNRLTLILEKGAYGTWVESTGHDLRVTCRSKPALERFVARQKITIDPAPVVEQNESQIESAKRRIESVTKEMARLNRLKGRK
jgi:hypothetical protein